MVSLLPPKLDPSFVKMRPAVSLKVTAFRGAAQNTGISEANLKKMKAKPLKARTLFLTVLNGDV